MRGASASPGQTLPDVAPVLREPSASTVGLQGLGGLRGAPCMGQGVTGGPVTGIPAAAAPWIPPLALPGGKLYPSLPCWKLEELWL